MRFHVLGNVSGCTKLFVFGVPQQPNQPVWQPPINVNEAKSRIEAMASISRSPSQVRSFMERHGLRYIKAGHIPAKAGVEKQQQWMETILGPFQEQREGKWRAKPAISPLLQQNPMSFR